MRRRVAASCGALLGAVVAAPAAPAAAQPQDFAKVEIRVEKVAGSVHLLTGLGGNVALSVGRDGVVVVDDQFAPLVPRIREAIRGLTGAPVRYVLNTHWHFDHSGGNAAFAAVATKAELRKFIEMLRDCVALVRAARAQGLSLAQMQQRNVLAAYDALGRGFVPTREFIALIDSELERGAGR